MKKMLTVVLAVATMSSAFSCNAFAADISEESKSQVVSETTYKDDYEIEPYLDFSDRVFLSKEGYCNIVNDNNLLNARIRVKNLKGNPGAIWVQVLNSKGAILLPAMYVGLGDTKELGKINFDEGMFIVQAKAHEKSGEYDLEVTD